MYSCGICKTTPDQISHHKSHLETEKHKNKKELFELKLEKLNDSEKDEKYGITNVKNIVEKAETILCDSKKMNNKDDNINIPDLSIIKAMEEHNIISNKEALRDKIHDIHNYLRNNGAGYGMNALKVFNILYGLKKIEECGLLDKINLKRPECEFSYLLGLANTNDEIELTKLIYGPVLDSIGESKVNNLIFYEIPKKIKPSTFTHLIKEIDKISQIEKKCNVLLSGKIYEYFIGRDESAISELGAYFTDRHIVDYIYDKVQPELNPSGTIRTMIDMFGGSGGFTTGYINYLIKEHPDEINWKTEINKIFHYDMNEDVIKSAGLEFFCLTGQFPNMDTNVHYANSFKYEFNDRKYFYVFTNPPYGGDKHQKSYAQIKQDKIKNYIKDELKILKDEKIIEHRRNQLATIDKIEKQEMKDNGKSKVSVASSSARIQKFAKEHKLTGNDKESTSLILMMDMVKEDGTCCGVLKEGVFFDGTYKEIRACLIKNFNVREVISVPSNQFENTTTKTSIIIFDNTEEKTSEIKFSELVVEKCKEDTFEEIKNTIVLVKSKGDILSISDKLISVATIDELVKNPIFSLNGKDYNKKKIVCGKDYKLVKLGDICEFLPKSMRLASFGQNTGKFNFYTSSDKIQKCDVADYKYECIIIGTGGNSCIHYTSNFSCSADTIILKLNTISTKMIYYLIKVSWNILIDNMHGSTIKHITKDMLNNFVIPIPKSEKKIKEWVDKISKPYDEMNEQQKQLHKLEKNIQKEIQRITDEEECSEIKLGDITTIQTGKYISKDKFIPGEYPVYGGGDISKYINEYNREDALVISKDAISINCVRYVRGKFFLNHHGWTLQFNDNSHKNYVEYVLLGRQNDIYNLCYGSNQKGINQNIMHTFQIKIPQNKKFITLMKPMFEKVEQLRDGIATNEKLYKKYIQELSDNALPKNI